MEAIARPLRGLQADIAWFVRATELRLLHVMTDTPMRDPALTLAMGYENHADNRGLFFRFDDPMAGPGRGWPARGQRLRDQLVEKTAAIAPAGIHLRPLRPPPGSERGTSADLAAALMRMADVLAPPLTQVVMVMAPVRVDDPELFEQEMAALVGSPHLPHVRWIVLEADGKALAPLAGRLGRTALSCACVTDDSAAEEDLAALGAAASAAAPVVITPRRSAWRAPGVMPDVEPPARPGLARAPTDAEITAAGLSPLFVNGGGDALKKLVLGGALAMRQRRPQDALKLQARAAELCGEMRMPKEQVINLHVLGGYLIAAAHPARAREVYAQSLEIALAHEQPDLAAQSELALGMLDTVERRITEAGAHYAAAGRLAETAQSPPLAIECWRMAGQLALDSNLETTAIERWKRALALAGALDPALAMTTSASEVARALAAVCRKRGLTAQAHALDQRSLEIEQGSAAPAAAAPAAAAPAAVAPAAATTAAVS